MSLTSSSWAMALSVGLTAASPNLLAATYPVGSDFCTSEPADLTTGKRISAVRALSVDEIRVDANGLPTGEFWPEGEQIGTWAVFGDTQDFYAITNPVSSGQHYNFHLGESCTNESFTTRVDWLVANRDALQLDGVTHLGDLVENMDNFREWAYARREIARLRAVMPVMLVVGNHDQTWGDTSVFSRFIPGGTLEGRSHGAMNGEHFQGFAATNWLNHVEVLKYAACDEDAMIYPPVDVGMTSGDGANSCLISVDRSGRKWLFMSLQCAVPQPVLDWADRMLTKYADHRAVIFEHEYIGRVNYNIDYLSPEGRDNIGRMRCKRYAQNQSTSAQHQWETVWSRHPNVALVMCGHEPEGLAMMFEERGDYGNTVLSILQNYPQIHYSDWVRLYRCDMQNDKMYVYTYSPSRKKLCRGDEQDFVKARSGEGTFGELEDDYSFATNCVHHFVIDLKMLGEGTRKQAAEPIVTTGLDFRGKPYEDLRPIKDGLTFWNANQAIVTRVSAITNGVGGLNVRYKVFNDCSVKIGKPGVPGKKGGYFVVKHRVQPEFWIDDGSGRRRVREEAVAAGGEAFEDGGWKNARIDLGKMGIEAATLTNATVTVVLKAE